MKKLILLAIVMAGAACGDGPVGPSPQPDSVEYRLSGTGAVTAVEYIRFTRTADREVRVVPPGGTPLPWAAAFESNIRYFELWAFASCRAYSCAKPGCLKAEIWFNGTLEDSYESCAPEPDPDTPGLIHVSVTYP